MIIIEPFHHFEVLHSLLRMIEIRGESVTVITNHFCKAHIRFKNADFITWYTSDKAEEVIQQKQILLRECSTILFSTVDISSIFWQWKHPTSNVYVYIHNAHNFFNLKSYRTPGFINSLKYIAYQLRGDFRKQKLVLYQTTALLLPNAEIINHLSSELSTYEYNKVKVLPFAFPNHAPQIQSSQPVNICIPGTVSNKSRNYQLIADYLKIVDASIHVPVRLTLLGRIDEENIRQAFKKLVLQNIQIITFSNHVAPDLYEKEMRKTDFLLLPLRRKLIYKAHYEYFGQSSVSGNINDLTQFALPAILPDFYPLDSSLEGLVERYRTKDKLVEILTNWINNRTFNNRKKQGTAILTTYQNRVLISFEKLFDSE